jgi:hypothetical protein
MARDVLLYLDEHIQPLRQIVDALTNDFAPPIDETIAYLESAQAIATVEQDPYWPKWNNPWWQALLLEELGLPHEIPDSFIEQYAENVDRHFLHFFPFTEEQIPPGSDPTRHIACHCYLGSLHRHLQATKTFDSDLKLADGRILAGRMAVARTIPSDSFDAAPDHERALSWVRPWFLKYQMDGGGLNCDEAKYVCENPTCSVLSTVPALEAMLDIETSSLTEDELAFLDKGVEYLLERQLFRSKRTGEVIDKEWLEPAFPRFYFYDTLRGLTLVTRWALKRSRKLQRATISEALDLLSEQVTAEGLIPKRSNLKDKTTIVLDDGGSSNGARHPAMSFPLLDYVDVAGKPSLPLTQEYLGLLLRLKYMSDARLLR